MMLRILPSSIFLILAWTVTAINHVDRPSCHRYGSVAKADDASSCEVRSVATRDHRNKNRYISQSVRLSLRRRSPHRRVNKYVNDTPSPLGNIFASSRTNYDQLDEPRQHTMNARNNFWPPWPFNMLQQKDPNTDSSVEQQYQSKTVASVVWSFTKKNTKVGIRNIQELGSQLWFHSPPSVPPILLYALYPYRQRIVTVAGTTMTSIGGTATDNVVYRTILPFWSNAWVRNGILFTTGLAIVSWAHAEIHRRRNLTPLPLLYRDLSRAELPPFLPEQVSTTGMFGSIDSAVLPQSSTLKAVFAQEDGETGASAVIVPSLTGTTASTTEDEALRVEGIMANLSPRLRRHWMQLRDMAPRPASLRTVIGEWQRMRQIRKAERHNAHRLAIYEELATWQQATTRPHRLSHTSKSGGTDRRHLLTAWKPFNSSNNVTATTTATSDLDSIITSPANGLGYALVTGASQGIGRAIAVELARWRIPLILVARDARTLTDLAFDLQTCYGVECSVLPADLSRPNTAEQIYKTVTDAGLKVDFLVNNAGISSHGESLNMSLDEVVRMIQVNTVAVTSLTHLFGRDMKERRRGRILLVSSVCGAVSGIATVAVYAATKAFENSFGVAIGKELEPYGVGVTCLMPGAVRGTEFRSRSNSHEALCWKIPFYSKTPPAVAECGVRAMLRGDTEVMPGVLNRMFVKVLKPILPQRLHNLLAEIMWNPLNLPFRRKNSDTFEAVAVESIEKSKLDSNTSTDWIVDVPLQRPIVVRPQLYLSNQASPRQLVLEDLVPTCNHETVADVQVLTENPAAATSQEADGTSSGDSVGETATTTSNGDLITNRHIPPDMKQDDQRNTSDSNGEKSNANHHSNVERIDKEAETQNAPSPSGELDLLLDQYKRHRALSIDDPWSSGFNDRYLSDPMLPSFTEEDSIPNGQEV